VVARRRCTTGRHRHDFRGHSGGTSRRLATAERRVRNGDGIRRAEMTDAPALLAIYNHYVATTHITFDIEPRTLAQRETWLAQSKPAGRHQCFVAVRDGAAIGWACSGPFKDRAAYDTSVETSVYLAPGEQGKGVGRRLYRTLFDALKGEDLHRAFAGVTQP